MQCPIVLQSVVIHPRPATKVATAPTLTNQPPALLRELSDDLARLSDCENVPNGCCSVFVVPQSTRVTKLYSRIRNKSSKRQAVSKTPPFLKKPFPLVLRHFTFNITLTYQFARALGGAVRIFNNAAKATCPGAATAEATQIRTRPPCLRTLDRVGCAFVVTSRPPLQCFK